MIKTISGALRAIKQADTADKLNELATRLGAIAWNDGGAIKQAIEEKRSTFYRELPSMTDNEHDPKVLALAAHLKVSPDTISECRHGDNQYESDAEPGEYLVLTDSEADAAFKESVESYVDECVLTELPEQYRGYFNTEAFMRDVELGDGRGPSLAGYDGAEQEEQVEGTWYFIYRVN